MFVRFSIIICFCRARRVVAVVVTLVGCKLVAILPQM